MRFAEVKRSGWILQCPFCNLGIRYALITNVDGPVPFFYAENGNDILLRKQDRRRVEALYERYGGLEPPENELESLWNSILSNSPAAPCGGKFGLWANVKCPNCCKELPYAAGAKNIRTRIFEPKIVLIDNATIVGDSSTESWHVKVAVDSGGE